MAANPPLGAVVDYVVDSDQVVTLSIVDATGARVRSVSSADAPKAIELDKIEIAPEWLGTGERVETGAGAHRFVWDLHYAVPKALVSDDPSDEEHEEGVWAPPGKYWIEMRTPSGRYRQPLTVVPDPRAKLPAAAYAQEFALARKIEASRVRIAVALAEAAKLHESITKASKLADPSAAQRLLAADRQLIAMDVIAPAKDSPDFLGRPPATVEGLRYLSAAFNRLARAVDGADGAPTPDALQSYLVHEKLLSAALGAWTRFKAGEQMQGINTADSPAAE